MSSREEYTAPIVQYRDEMDMTVESIAGDAFAMMFWEPIAWVGQAMGTGSALAASLFQTEGFAKAERRMINLWAMFLRRTNGAHKMWHE